MNTFTLDHAKSWVRSSQFRIVAGVVVAILALILAFQAGVAFGFHRAAFSYRLDQNYARTFGRTTDRFMMPGPGVPGGHGAFGKIISVNGSTVVIAADNHPEQQVVIAADTIIRNQDGTASSSALTTGQYVIVFGDPSDTGSIDARLIRIVPPPDTQGNVMFIQRK